MANKKQQEEKHLKLLRQMLTLADNKKCMDCKEKGPFYACTTFGTFVCPTCSGIHREFGHRVKSISMATFTPEEVKFLQEMGNGRASDIWLANWTPSDYPEPDAGDKEKIKEFMHKKYVQKVWYRKPGSEEPSRKVSRERPQSRGRGSEPPKTEPLESILGKDIPPIQITHNIHVNVPNMPQKKEKATKPDLLWEEPVPVIPPHHQSAHHGPISAPPPITTPAPQTPNSSVLPGLESLFTAPIHEAPKPQTPTWPPVVPQQPAPLAGPMPQITTEIFQQMNPQQQQHYLAMQQQWLQQQQLLLQQRMGSTSIGQPAPYSAPYSAPINPFAVPQVPQGYGVPHGYPTAPIPATHAPLPSHTTSAPLLPTQPKEVKKPESSNSLLFADLSPLGAKSSASSTPAPTLSASRPGPMDFGALQGAPLTPSNSTQAPTPYNPFGF